MFEIPQDEQIEAIFSELKSHADQGRDDEGQKNPDHDDYCDFCKLNEELDKRNKAAGDGNLNAIDSIIFNAVQSNPHLAMMTNAPFFGAEICSTLSLIGRACFLVGLKTMSMRYEAEELKKLFPDL